MATLMGLDLYDVKVENRDFQGKKFGPQYRTFAVTMNDSELIETLGKCGVEFWHTTPRNDDPPRTKMNVRVDNRYGDVQIVLVDADGTPIKLNPDNPGDAKFIDGAWMEKAAMHIDVVQYTNPRTGAPIVTPMLKSLIAHILPQEEVEKIRANGATRTDPIREKFAQYFD